MMVESKISMSFPRDYYLECAEEFEANRIDCVDQELSEFNHDEEDLAYELAYTRYTLAREELELEHLRAQVAELEDQKEAVIQQAQIWRQEARTMRNIVAERYQAVTGSAGEPGDWNGAKPVREAISELKGGRDKIESALKKMISMYIIDDYICGEDRENKIKDIFRRMMEESKS